MPLRFVALRIRHGLLPSAAPPILCVLRVKDILCKVYIKDFQAFSLSRSTE